MIRRILSFLPLPVLLLSLWLVLNDSLALGQIVLGSAIACVLAFLSTKIRLQRARLAHPLVALRLIWHVAVDITHSNIAVGKRVLEGNRSLAIRGFLHIPLRIRDPHGLAALACIVTFTPGTVWAGHDAEKNELVLHVLDLHDPKGLTHTIQERYERPLMAIFERAPAPNQESLS